MKSAYSPHRYITAKRTPIADWLEKILEERSTERKDQEIYCLAGFRLAKLKIEALRKDYPSEATEFSCVVIEIDGVEIAQEERAEARHTLMLDRAPTVDEQQHVIKEALYFFDLPATIALVSETYVQGHLRLARLRHRLIQKRRTSL